MAATLAVATAAPAAAHTITPTHFDFGTVPDNSSPSTVFTVTAVGTSLSGQGSVVTGDKAAFRATTATTAIPVDRKCGNGTLDPGESCQFSVLFTPVKPGTYSYNAVVGFSGGPTATVSARTGGASTGKKKKCKKKGKKGAASAKKKKCKKKGKK